MVCFLYAFTEASTKSHLAFAAQDLPYGDNSIGFTTTHSTNADFLERSGIGCVCVAFASSLSIDSLQESLTDGGLC